MSRYILLALSASMLCLGSAHAQVIDPQPVQVSLPDLLAEDIARDVTTQFNPRTGAPERLAPSFDPFEDADDLAADARLRSTGPVRDLGGRTLGDGAVLDISVFYNSDGTRDFGRMRDALYLSGQPVPIVSRDSVELECSSRVTETIYAYDPYYGGAADYGGLVRARPRYYGHSGFGIGFGYGGAGRGYDRFGGYGYGNGYGRGYRGYGYGGGYSSHPPRRRDRHPERRVRDHGNGVVVDDAGRGRPERTRDYHRGSAEEYRRKKRRERDRPAVADVRDPDSRRPGDGRRGRRGDRVDTPDTTSPRPRRDRQDRVMTRGSDIGSDTRSLDLSGPSRPRRVDRPVTDAPRRRRGGASSGRIEQPNRTAPAPRSRPASQPQSAPRARPVAKPKPVSKPRPVSKPKPAARPKPVSKPKPISKPKASKPKAPPVSRPRPSRRDASTNNRRRLDLFPGDRGDAVVVSSSRDCARQDTLSVFIPAERLDAARFDGLTLILRDVLAQPATGLTQVYDERPLYIPPNYIEGFRLALDPTAQRP